jgi:hypothetical protein
MTNKLILAQEFEIFPDNETELIQLADDNKNLVVTEELFDQAKKARQNLRAERFTIQKIQKANKGILNELKGQNDSIAAKLINIIAPVEGEIDLKIKSIEAKKSEVKAAKDRAKAEQMTEWNRKAQLILDHSDTLINALTVEDIENVITQVDQVDLTEDQFGAYLLIAQQNVSKVLEQAETVMTRVKEAIKVAQALVLAEQEKEIAREQEQEKIKAEQIVTARVDFKGYFHSIPNVEHTAEHLNQLVEDDKQMKLDKLAAIEKAEQERNDLLESYFDYSGKKGNKLSNEKLIEKITILIAQKQKIVDAAEEIPTPTINPQIAIDTQEVKDWMGSFMDVSPSTSDKELNDVIDKAIEFVNELLGNL